MIFSSQPIITIYLATIVYKFLSGVKRLINQEALQLHKIFLIIY